MTLDQRQNIVSVLTKCFKQGAFYRSILTSDLLAATWLAQFIYLGSQTADQEVNCGFAFFLNHHPRS